MNPINELEYLLKSISNFYANIKNTKKANKRDLMDLYLKDKLSKSILLLNIKSEYNLCSKAYEFLVRTLSYQNKKKLIKIVRENKKDFPEVYDAIMIGFEILIKTKNDFEKLINILEREIAYVDNKEKLKSIYENEEIPILIKIEEKNKIWSAEHNAYISRLIKNKKFISFKRSSEAGFATKGTAYMVGAVATVVLATEQMKNIGAGKVLQSTLVTLEILSKNGILFAIIGLMLFSRGIKKFKED